MNKNLIIPADLREEIALRHDRLREIMAANGADAMLVSSNANLYYTSLRFFRGYVYIPVKGDAIFFVIRPIGLEGEDVAYIRKPEQIAAELTAKRLDIPANLALELDVLSWSEASRLQRALTPEKTLNASAMLREARIVKTPWEIARMEEDGRHHAAAYSRIEKIYRTDMTDLEFQIEIERLLRLEGSLGYYRVSGNLMEICMGSVINGDNADAPTPYDFSMGGEGLDLSLPGGANGAVMKPGTSVMVDMNGAFNGYQTDMTRVWSIGTLPDLALKAHETSRAILRRLEQIGTPGTPVADLYNEAMKIVEENGLENYFMGHSQKVAFIGHGVGIELNEMPVVMAKSRDVLREGMTLALEPKFVIPHVGAVGVENTYVVTNQGLRTLTKFPEEIEDLER